MWTQVPKQDLPPRPMRAAVPTVTVRVDRTQTAAEADDDYG